MKHNLILTLFLIILGGLTSYFLSGSLLIYGLTLILASIIIYSVKINTNNRKENLNIIRDEKKLYFYLSDDLLFSIELPKNRPLSETLKDAIKKEMSTIKNITRKVCFINFKDDILLKELNQSLNLYTKD
jgi:hypothetical protein